MAAGQQLKLFRNRRKITVRDVEQASRRIAEAKGDKRFRISNGWLVQLENGVSQPNIYQLFSLSVIYHVNLPDLLRLYGIDVDDKGKYEPIANPHLTQLLSPANVAEMRWDERSRTNGVTSLMPEIAAQRATPLVLAQGNCDSHLVYGYLGSIDETMYPLIWPGSILRIDPSQNKPQNASWHNEFHRPIYFIELRDAYACGWCELKGNQLLIIPHPSSPASVRQFIYPREAEIVGRVVAYYTRCIEPELARNARRRSTMA